MKTFSSDWIETIKVLSGLYPRWQVTDEQITVWREEFGVLNQNWVQDAIRLMYQKYSGENPKPKWLSDCFREIKAGKTGIPLGESDFASRKRQEDREEELRHEREVEQDRERNWIKLKGWTREERELWATAFSQRFPSFKEKIDKGNMNSWSKTFCSFVAVFRQMVEEGRFAIPK